MRISTLYKCTHTHTHIHTHIHTHTSTICPLGDYPCLKAMFLVTDLKVKWMRGHHYVGGHIGMMMMLLRYVKPKVADCVHTMEVLARIAVKYPQSAYAGITMLMQIKLQHMSRAVPIV